MVFISIFIGLDMVMGRLRLGTVEGLVTFVRVQACRSSAPGRQEAACFS